MPLTSYESDGLGLSFEVGEFAQVQETEGVIVINVVDVVPGTIVLVRGTPEALTDVDTGVLPAADSVPAVLEVISGAEAELLTEYAPFPAWRAQRIDAEANIQAGLLIVVADGDWLFVSTTASIADYPLANERIFEPFLSTLEIQPIADPPQGIFGARR